MELEKTDQEQVEELQKWWHENRRALVAGLVIGIGGLVGWEQWQKVSIGNDMAASSAFDDVVRAVDSGNTERADVLLGTMQQEHAGSAYVVDALAARAALAARDGDWETAVKQLSLALDSGPDAAMAGLLRMRLARAQWGAGDADAALATLDAKLPASFETSAWELRGDIEMARGNAEAAREAWEKALEQVAGTPAAGLLNQKIARIGDAS